MKERNLAIVVMDTISLKKLLHLPDGIELCDMDYDIQSRRLMIKLEGPGLPLCREGQMIPAMMPALTERITPEGFHKVEWDFTHNLDSAKVDG